MAENTGPKRLGRPKQKPVPGKRVSLGLRVTAETKSRLDEAAERSGRSQSQEAELRLERTFDDEYRQGGPMMIELMEAIVSVMKSAGRQAGYWATGKRFDPLDERDDQDEWMSVPYAFDQAIKAAVTVLEHHRPPGEVVTPMPFKFDPPEGPEADEILRDQMKTFGERLAERELEKKEVKDG